MTLSVITYDDNCGMVRRRGETVAWWRLRTAKAASPDIYFGLGIVRYGPTTGLVAMSCWVTVPSAKSMLIHQQIGVCFQGCRDRLSFGKCIRLWQVPVRLQRQRKPVPHDLVVLLRRSESRLVDWLCRIAECAAHFSSRA
jgi:hypothetical protein